MPSGDWLVTRPEICWVIEPDEPAGSGDVGDDPHAAPIAAANTMLPGYPLTLAMAVLADPCLLHGRWEAVRRVINYASAYKKRRGPRDRTARQARQPRYNRKCAPRTRRYGHSDPAL